MQVKLMSLVAERGQFHKAKDKDNKIFDKSEWFVFHSY